MDSISTDTRFITHGRVRHDLVELRTEMLIPVDGTDQWREARYETRYGRLQGEDLCLTPILRPILWEGERLLETAEEPVAIVTTANL